MDRERDGSPNLFSKATKLGFRSGDLGSWPEKRVLVFGEKPAEIGVDHILLNDDGLPVEHVPDATVDILLSEIPIDTAQSLFLRQVREMVRMVRPGGQVRLYGLPRDALPTILKMLSDSLGEKIGTAFELLKDRSAISSGTVVILSVRFRAGREWLDKDDYGIFW